MATCRVEVKGNFGNHVRVKSEMDGAFVVFDLPIDLRELLRDGIWPKTRSQADAQNLRCLISAPAVREFAPDESSLFLYPPPFHTVQQELQHAGVLTPEQWAVRDIVPRDTMIIGDFGAGSDTCLALDYWQSRLDPPVIRLQWRLPKSNNQWVEVFPSFQHFALHLRRNLLN